MIKTKEEISISVFNSNHDEIRLNSTKNEIIEIEVTIPECLCPESLFLIFNGISYYMEKKAQDLWTYKIDLNNLTEKLYTFHFRYFSYNSIKYICSDLPCAYVTEDKEQINEFTFFVYKEDFKTPDKIKGGIIYQIFPDRFKRSGKVSTAKKDIIINDDWNSGIPEYPNIQGGTLKNNTFFAGDLYGIADELDYLLSLGVNCIYLNPIFEAYSNHRYDTGDYSKVDSLLGGNEAFEYLLSKCDEKEISIILDGVFNHTGDDSKYFNKYSKYPTCGAYNSPNSDYRKWYYFHEDGTYDSWWGIDILPRVKCDEPSYGEYINGENGIIRKYLKKGILGYRLDVVDELSDTFLVNLRKAAKAENPNSVIIGEVWEDATTKYSYGKLRDYLTGNELDSVMNYPLKNALINYVISGNSDIIYKQMEIIYSRYPKPAIDLLMNFLGTHDTSRILTVLGGSPDIDKPNPIKAKSKLGYYQRSLAKKRLTLAVCMLMTLPGIPTIYYGDEIGMEGYNDPFNRMPFAHSNIDNQILTSYQNFAAVRLSSTVYKEGKYLCLLHDGPIYAFERYNDDESVITVINAGSEIYNYSFKGKLISLLTGCEYINNISIFPMTCDVLKKI